MNIYSNDTYTIIKGAGAQAQKYFHTFTGTCHLFLSTFNFLNKVVKGSDEKLKTRYTQTYETLKGILNEYEVTGKKFEESFLLFSPRREAPNEGEVFETMADKDFKAIMENLKRRAIEEKREMEVEDLITEIFADNRYSIRDVLAGIVGSDMKADELREKVVASFKSVKRKSIKGLDKLKELTNINEWVVKHPQVILECDREIGALEMALAGRTIQSAMITGPAGTGKTSLVYELAQRINSRKVPLFLQDKIIYQLDATALVAGTR